MKSKFAVTGMLAIILSDLASCASISPDMERAAQINVQLGVEYLRQGDLEQALKKLERAIQEDPNLPSAHNALALLRQRLGQSKEAEKHFHRAIKLDPSNSEAQNNYGVFLYDQERYREAEEHFLEAIKNPFYSTPALAYENAGLAVQKIGDCEKAKEYYRKALQLEQRLPQSLYHMAEINFEQGHYQEAQEYLQRYWAVTQHTARSLWLSIRIEDKLNNKDAVSSYALLLRQNFPDSNEAQLLRGSMEKQQ
jgi:type IV pilus assembly protein PilF